ncbi:hypothetical protein FCV25MIE_23957 [Fagus crenata]
MYLSVSETGCNGVRTKGGDEAVFQSLHRARELYRSRMQKCCYAHGTSILAETGRAQVVLDAFSDGSSFICLQCGVLLVIIAN